MVTIAILAILAAVFITLAVKNWRRTIGAGPTILIVGGLVLSGYIPIKWNTYQARLREFDVCASRVERSTETRKFNLILIAAIEAIPQTDQLVSDLKDATPRELNLEVDCPAEPTFIKIFFSGFNNSSEEYFFTEEKP